jgi:hypothetical protein
MANPGASPQLACFILSPVTARCLLGQLVSAGGSIGGSQSAVPDTPNTRNTVASANEKRSGCQRHKREQKGVFNKVLALIVAQEANYRCHYRFLPI